MVERSVGKQFSPPFRRLPSTVHRRGDCFVAALLAMTTIAVIASEAHVPSEAWWSEARGKQSPSSHCHCERSEAISQPTRGVLRRLRRLTMTGVFCPCERSACPDRGVVERSAGMQFFSPRSPSVVCGLPSIVEWIASPPVATHKTGVRFLMSVVGLPRWYNP